MESASQPRPGKRVFTCGIAGLALLLVAGFGLWYYLTIFRHDRPPTDAAYAKILKSFQAAQPTALNVSPDGKYLLTRTEENRGFKISVLDRDTKREVVSCFSKNMMRSLTWRPDSQAIAYQEFSGLDRPLYILNIQTGGKMRVIAPVSQTALPPLRWSPTGKKLAYFEGDWHTGRLLVVDPAREDKPNIVQTSLKTSCDFCWSPDGSRIAAATDDDGAVTVTALGDFQKSRFEIVDGTNNAVHDLAWSPDGKFILVAARGQRDQFFKLFEIEIATKKISVKAQAAGDISHPVWMPDSQAFFYHVDTNGVNCAFFRSPASSADKEIGPTNGVLHILHVDSGGKSAYAHFSSLTAPPVLGQISLDDGRWALLYAGPESEECRCPEPEFITLKSADGVAVPAYHWAAGHQTGVEPSVLVVAHGGEHTQTYPTWEVYIHLATSLGCDVIAPNHRRSSGYGQYYETLRGDAYEDVLAACDYAANTLHVKPSRIFMTGLSTGSRLVAGAASHGGKFGGLFLVSWPGGTPPADSRFDRSYPVFEFHGQLDAVLSPGKARRSVEKFFAGDGQGHPDIQYQVYEDEGHFFYQNESLAAIYWQILKLVQAGQ